jgi:polysaccharide export outer membrane protein
MMLQAIRETRSMAARFFLLAALSALAACGGRPLGENLPRGTAAYEVIPAATTISAAADYRVGPLDALDVTVFQEPELSLKGVVVDASGNIALPLIGSMAVNGKTATELSRELEKRFGETYLKDPQVTVAVASSVSQKVTIQGEVTQPGVYPLKGPTTLLEAISLARGETQIASLREVVVFRTIDGQRMGAVFDVDSIRRGEASDPQVQGNDVVVVGLSSAKSMWRDILGATRLMNVFRPVAF